MKDNEFIATPEASSEMGITQEYSKDNRDKLWDSAKGKSEYKDKIFGDKQTIKDPISGKTLHKCQQAAQNKYHMKNSAGEKVSAKWADHSAETDHINALKDVHDIAKHNPFLTDNDFKEVMNSEENYRVISKSDNTSKGAKSDWQIIADKNSGISAEGKVLIAKEKIRSDAALHGKFAVKSAQNAGKEFVSGASDAVVGSAIPLTVEAVKKMIDVAQGKETLADAAKDMGKVTMNVAVTGGANRLLIDTISVQLANSKSALLKNVAQSSTVGQIVAVASIVQESAVRYINGEINGEEFVEEVGVKGAAMAAGMIGGQVGCEIGSLIGGAIGTTLLPGVGTTAGVVAGRVIGEILGAVITTVVCGSIVSVYTSIKNTFKSMDDYKIKEGHIKSLESDAIAEIERQRLVFKEIVEREYSRWDNTIQSGLDKMITNSLEESFDLQGITDGLDQILSLFGKSVAFRTREEYEAQLDKPLKLNF